MGVVNPLVVTALKTASGLSNSSRGHLHWRKRGWTEVPPLPPRQELSFLCHLDSELCCLPHKWEIPQSNSNIQLKIVHWRRSGLPSPSPHNIKCSFCYVSIPEGYALWIQVHITRLFKYYQSRCQFMHSFHCLKPKRTATSYSLGGTVTEKMEFMQENEDFRKALLTHTCLELYILVHGKPLLVKPTERTIWHLTYCKSCPHFICIMLDLWGFFPSLLLMTAY